MAPRDSIFAVRAPQQSALTTLAAPVGGLNARDALANMQPQYAVILENLFPTRSGLMVRPGWSRFYKDIPAPGNVETIIKFNASDGTEKIFACANGTFIDATAGGTFAPTDIVLSGLTNNRWQYVQLANQIGDFTVAVNGSDVPKKYDGTSWTDSVITADPIGFPDFDPRRLISVAQMHRRLWFVERDSPRVWYLPTDEVQGEVSLFDCGEIFPLGGFVQTCISWSVDTGSGMDDQSVFISSKGNVAVFTGFDPDDATNFTLSGVYTIGATVGRRCACPYGSDVLILSEDGAIALTSILSQSKILMQPPITDIIQHQLSEVVDAFSSEFGWDLFTSARHNQLYLNVPDPQGKYQFLMNTILDAWCVIKGYEAFCWENFYEEPYFGGATYVGRAWDDSGIDDPTITIVPIQLGNRVTDTGDVRITDIGDIRVVDDSISLLGRVTDLGDERITEDGDLRVVASDIVANADRVTEDGFNRITADGDQRICDGDNPPPAPIEIITGKSIQTRCLQAFSYFGSPAQKNWSMARPVFLSESKPIANVFFNTDFEVVENFAPLPSTENASTSALWDVALWDVGLWSGGDRTWKQWYGLNNIGFAGAIFLRTSTTYPTTWLATDFQFIKGGTL